jgi:hypothetical protein
VKQLLFRRSSGQLAMSNLVPMHFNPQQHCRTNPPGPGPVRPDRGLSTKGSGDRSKP